MKQTNKLKPSKNNQNLSLLYGLDLVLLERWGSWEKIKAIYNEKNLESTGLHVPLTSVCNMSLGGFLKGKHRHLFSKEAFCSHFLVLDGKCLLAGRPWVGINWSSGEGVLMVLKYSLLVSWLSQKCSSVNLLTRGFADIRIFFSVHIYTCKSCCSTRLFFCSSLFVW